MEKKELQHIAIIMDGNGRWAKKRNLPRIMGHYAGARTVEKIITAAIDMGIPYVSIYAFSTENWNRANSEVLGLMGLFRYYAKFKIKVLCKRQVRFRFSGVLSELPDDFQKMITDTEEATKDFTECQMIACLNYGGRRELLDAFNKIQKENYKGEITEDIIRSHLYLPDVPDPDLIIRTSGELRLSNFLLWQSAYSEYYFTDKYWPDFDEKDLEDAIKSYYERDRRYGKA